MKDTSKSTSFVKVHSIYWLSERFGEPHSPQAASWRPCVVELLLNNGNFPFIHQSPKSKAPARKPAAGKRPRAPTKKSPVPRKRAKKALSESDSEADEKVSN